MMHQEEIREVIAEEVRAAAGRSRLNRTELADKADISRSAINRKMNGETSFTTEEIIRVALALNISIENLLLPGSEAA